MLSPQSLKILLLLSLFLPVCCGATETEPDELPNISPADQQASQPQPNLDEAKASSATAPDQKPAAEVVGAQPISFLNSSISPGTFRTLHWSPGLSMDSLNTPVPVLVAHGAEPGPTLCLTAAVHGDELNGIEIVRRVLHQTEPDDLSGTIIGMPIVNLDGFRRGSRYMTDRRDLNRFFPGNPLGSYASRVAYSLFYQVIVNCDYLLDIHTGSFKRTNLSQLRGDLKNKRILKFSSQFGGMSVLHHPGGVGTLRRAASDAGISAITMETGGPHILDQNAVAKGVKGIKNMLHNLGMYKTLRLWAIPQPVFYQSVWVRSNQGGILLGMVKLDQKVQQGDMLGRVIDPITNTSSDIVSPLDGIVLGKAVDQVVSPGFATFHIGRVTTEEKLAKKAPAQQTQAPGTNDQTVVTEPVPSGQIPAPAQDQSSPIQTEPHKIDHEAMAKEAALPKTSESETLGPDQTADTKAPAVPEPSSATNSPPVSTPASSAPASEKPAIPKQAPEPTMPLPLDTEDESIMDMDS